jgi:DUF1680 family protein
MLSRRSFLQSTSLGVPAISSLLSASTDARPPLDDFGYGDVALMPGLAQTQFEQTQSVLLGLNEDSLLKPWRLRAGLPAPGPDLGGWYDEVPLVKTESGGHGYAPAHSFGQWLSALARGYAVNRDAATRAKLERLLALYEPTISTRFYVNFRFPAYNYDKLVIGLIDAHTFAGLPNAYELLNRTTDAAEPRLPPHALGRGEPQSEWRKSIGDDPGKENTRDESYTLPENLFLAWQRGAGDRYLSLANRFMMDREFFDPLSENQDVLAHHHAYSFCNALNSAMLSYLATGSQKHLRAASNAFTMLTTSQSFATGGWGPNEGFSTPGSGALYDSLTKTHRGFETPCGSYAHLKLTRYLLRVTRDGRYGDSMERVFYNTVLGAKRLEPDGRAFYYSDYHSPGQKSYFPDAWPCCSGTLPQVTADYRLLIYFRDIDGIFVNLYLPSTLRATNADGAQLTLTQTGDYPFDGKITMRLGLSRPSKLSVRLRIPAWSLASNPVIRVNGARLSPPVTSGFATLSRRWDDGDRIEIDLPLPTRLEPIDPQHPDTVALMRGPLVLFPITETSTAVTRAQLLSATRLANQSAWQANTGSGPLELRPFTAIQDQPYTTYLNVTGTAPS